MCCLFRKNYASHQKHDANRTEKQKSDYLQKHKLRQREKRQRLKEQGICPVCMKRPVSKGFKSCIECRTKKSKKRKEKENLIGKHLVYVPIVMNHQFPASVAVRSTMQAALLESQNVGSQRVFDCHKSNRKSA